MRDVLKSIAITIVLIGSATAAANNSIRGLAQSEPLSDRTELSVQPWRCISQKPNARLKIIIGSRDQVFVTDLETKEKADYQTQKQVYYTEDGFTRGYFSYLEQDLALALYIFYEKGETSKAIYPAKASVRIGETVYRNFQFICSYTPNSVHYPAIGSVK